MRLILKQGTLFSNAHLFDTSWHAFATARRLKLGTMGFAGDDGGKMVQIRAGGLLDYCLTVPTSSIDRIQETHITLYHIMWDLVHEFSQHKSLVQEVSATGEHG